MAFVAVRGFASEQFIARLFLGRKLRLPSHYIVILGRERVHFSGTLEGRDRFRDSIEGGLRNSPIDRCEMKRRHWERPVHAGVNPSKNGASSCYLTIAFSRTRAARGASMRLPRHRRPREDPSLRR